MTLPSVPLPVLVWVGLSALALLGSIRNPLSFGLTLGVGALSCGLLLGGFPHLFIGFEFLLWLLSFTVIVLARIVRPPGDSQEGAEGSLSVATSIRFASAVAVWLCL